MKVYVASSFRNTRQPEVVQVLRDHKYDVYDFRDSANGAFHWSHIDPGWQDWTPKRCRDALDHELAVKAFESDKTAMEAADVCVLVQPCGRSAHLEAGWFAAQPYKHLIILLADGDPESMFKLADVICVSTMELLGALDKLRLAQRQKHAGYYRLYTQDEVANYESPFEPDDLTNREMHILTVGQTLQRIDDTVTKTQLALDELMLRLLHTDTSRRRITDGSFVLEEGEAATLEPALIAAGWKRGEW